MTVSCGTTEAAERFGLQLVPLYIITDMARRKDQDQSKLTIRHRTEDANLYRLLENRGHRHPRM